MRWWRRRLLTGSTGTGSSGGTGLQQTVDELLKLLGDLRDIEDAEARERQRASRGRTLAASEGDAFGPTPLLKRPRSSARVDATATAYPEGGSAANAAVARSDTGDGSCAIATAAAAVEARSSQAGGAAGNNSLTSSSQPPPPSLSLARQMRGFLLGELLRSVRPSTALVVLQALACSSSSSCTLEAAVYSEVRQRAYDKLAGLSAAQRLQLPVSFRTPGHADYLLLKKAAARPLQPPDECCEAQQQGQFRAKGGCTGDDGCTGAGHGIVPTGTGGGGASSPPAAVASLLQSAQHLIRGCDAWQRAQQEKLLLAARGRQQQHR